MNTDSKKCPECSGGNLYEDWNYAGGGHAPYYLRGLGGFLRIARFQVVVCADCGLTRFFAEQSARANLPTSGQWRRI